MEYQTKVEVRYAETDQMGIVYHANYLVWFEVARTKFFDSMGYPYDRMEKDGFMCPVLSVEIQYGTPFKYGEVAVVYTSITKVSPVKVEYSYRIFKEGEDPSTVKPSITGKSSHCIVDAKTFKPISMKRNLPDLYDKYLSLLAAE